MRRWWRENVRENPLLWLETGGGKRRWWRTPWGLAMLPALWLVLAEVIRAAWEWHFLAPIHLPPWVKWHFASMFWDLEPTWLFRVDPWSRAALVLLSCWGIAGAWSRASEGRTREQWDVTLITRRQRRIAHVWIWAIPVLVGTLASQGVLMLHVTLICRWDEQRTALWAFWFSPYGSAGLRNLLRIQATGALNTALCLLIPLGLAAHACLWWSRPLLVAAVTMVVCGLADEILATPLRQMLFLAGVPYEQWVWAFLGFNALGLILTWGTLPLHVAWVRHTRT